MFSGTSILGNKASQETSQAAEHHFTFTPHHGNGDTGRSTQEGVTPSQLQASKTPQVIQAHPESQHPLSVSVRVPEQGHPCGLRT